MVVSHMKRQRENVPSSESWSVLSSSPIINENIKNKKIKKKKHMQLKIEFVGIMRMTEWIRDFGFQMKIF